MKKAIVFGSGEYYRKKKESVLKSYEIVAFIDNSVKNEEYRGSEIDGVKVYNPSYVRKIQDTEILIMSNSQYAMSMQLINELRVLGNRIVFGIEFSPTYDLLEDVYRRNGTRYVIEKESFIIYDNIGRKEVKSYEDIIEYNRKIYDMEFPDIKKLLSLSNRPVSSRWGKERGKPVDRYYIEKFLADNQICITGDVMEVADNYYTKMYANIGTKSHILHLEGWGEGVIKGNLATGEGINEESMDCLILTQTLQFIYDIDSTVRNIYRLLKPGGTALITGHGIAQISMYDYRNWGEYWRFTDIALKELFGRYFGSDNVKSTTYGNVKVATALLYGLAREDISEEDYSYNDPQYPCIVGIKAIKRNM